MSPHLYIFVATGVIALVGTVAVVLLVCKKWKQKKAGDKRGAYRGLVGDEGRGETEGFV